MADDLPDAPWTTAQATPSGDSPQLPDAPWAKPSNAEDFPGIMQSAGLGLKRAVTGVGEAFGSEAQAPSEAEKQLQQPYEWSDLYHPTHGLAKTAYQFAGSAPSLVGGVAGGAAGAAVAGPVGAIAGGAAGAGLGAGVGTVGPVFHEELQKTPDDPDGAYNRAIEHAGVSGAFSALGWAAFPVKFFQGPLKNAVFQAAGVQGPLSVAEKGAQNVLSDKPVTEGMGQAYTHGVVNTLVPTVGHAVVGKFAGAKTPEAAPAAEPEGKPAPLSSDVSGGMPEAEQLAAGPQRPPSPSEIAKNATDTLLGVGKNLQELVAPMATGSQESMAAAKDYMNSLRTSQYDLSKHLEGLNTNFTPEQFGRMWNALSEENVMRRSGEQSEHIGLATLDPNERMAVDALLDSNRQAWSAAKDAGLVEGDGFDVYDPRMIINIANKLGDVDMPYGGLRTTTPNLKRRNYLTADETEAAAKTRFGEQAELVRDIRALPLATAKLEQATAGRLLVNQIKETGSRTGTEPVVEGNDPGKGYFTLPHSALTTWRPRLNYNRETGKFDQVNDADGNPIFDRVPIYISNDFKGPLSAVLTQRSGALYNAMMALKAKSMGLIMYSPLIHNAVEWGRALPAMPLKVATFRVYADGKRVLADQGQMREFIQNGLVPIGRRFASQDISDIIEQPNLAPGRSWTSQILGYVPGLFDPRAGEQVKSWVDKAGDIWHNKLLWDQVAKLQMGLATNFRDSLMQKGFDRTTATRVAAHWANRYAGAVPREAMSDMARKIANMALFSRSFTLGNLGAMKDVLTGLPRDVQAQIMRDTGGIDPSVAGYAKSLARRKAASILMMDMALMYAGNSFLQNAMNVMRGDSTPDKELRGYAERFHQWASSLDKDPTNILRFPEMLSATYTNEPSKQDRVYVGQTKDGQAIYMRNPAGKIGEEFYGYMTQPLEMIRRKLGTVARPALQVLSNDKGFGRHVYDPNAHTAADYAKNVGNIVWQFMSSQLPVTSLEGANAMRTGEGDQKLAALQTLGPFAGLTFSRGAPGGPAMGELYKLEEQHRYAVQQALPDIRKQIQRGDVRGAFQHMQELGIPPGLMRYYLRTTEVPASRMTTRKLQDALRYATPEQRQRLLYQIQRAGPQ